MISVRNNYEMFDGNTNMDKSNMNTAKELLESVYKKIEDYEKHKDVYEESYNIFQVLEVSEKEVMICRMLADIINPMGQHGCGAKFLQSFVEQVLRLEDVDETFYDDARVTKEYCIPQGRSGKSDRRIDIVIESAHWFIPIEVKIWAEDQKAQCYDYYHFALQKMNSNKAKIFYLTTGGTSPTEYSTSLETDNVGDDSIPEDGVINISFNKDICEWLRNILMLESEGRVKDMFAQYLDAIEDMSGAIGYEEGLLVEEAILENSSLFEAGLWIEKTMEQVKIKLMTTLMNEIRIEMKPLLQKYGLKELGSKSYYSVENQMGKYYKYNDSSYPGINYLVENAVLNDGKEVWFRVEIDWHLFAGFCLFDPHANEGKGNQVNEMDKWKKQIMSFFRDMPELENDDWWILWCYLPSGTHEIGSKETLCPEFKSFNRAAIRLADVDHRKEMVRKYVQVIEKELLSRLK